MTTELYQLNQRNQIKIWRIEVIDNGTSSDIITTTGIEGGKLASSVVTIKEGKNFGKANETTHYTQAIADATSKITSKKDEGYNEDKTKATGQGVKGNGFIAPMLAEKYDPIGKQKGSKTLRQLNLLDTQVVLQAKFDGNRRVSVVKMESDNTISVTAFSREGKQFPVLSHIDNQLKECFAKIYSYVNTKYGVTEYTIDGELMPPVVSNTKTKKFSFNRLNGLVKKYEDSLTPQDVEDRNSIEYYIYDVYLPVGYETRDKVKNYFKHTHLHPVESTYVIATEDTLRKFLEESLAAGEEGAMIRQLGIPYEHKRSWQLCKYKLFSDEEFEVVGVEEDARGGFVGAFVCKMTTPSVDRNGNTIDTFKAGCKMTHSELKEIWNNQDKYIGKFATIQYFELSEFQVPRFGKLVGFRNDVPTKK